MEIIHKHTKSARNTVLYVHSYKHHDM